eukprot:1568655-Prymnesium_polylepis.1
MRAATRAAEQSIMRSGGRDEVAAWTADTAQLQISALQADETEGRLEPEDWSLHHNLLARCGSARARARPALDEGQGQVVLEVLEDRREGTGCGPCALQLVG